MYTYITSGTLEFLEKIKDKHDDEKMLLMLEATSAQLVHETEGATIFQSPRKYEVVLSVGDLLIDSGFIACHNIPVREEGRPIFEYNFTNKTFQLDRIPGFKAMRVLRPLSNETYIVMTMWESEKFYKDWQHTKQYEESFSLEHLKKSVENTNILSGPSYISTFVVGKEDES